MPLGVEQRAARCRARTPAVEARVAARRARRSRVAAGWETKASHDERPSREQAHVGGASRHGPPAGTARAARAPPRASPGARTSSDPPAAGSASPRRRSSHMQQRGERRGSRALLLPAPPPASSSERQPRADQQLQAEAPAPGAHQGEHHERPGPQVGAGAPVRLAADGAPPLERARATPRGPSAPTNSSRAGNVPPSAEGGELVAAEEHPDVVGEDGDEAEQRQQPRGPTAARGSSSDDCADADAIRAGARSYGTDQREQRPEGRSRAPAPRGPGFAGAARATTASRAVPAAKCGLRDDLEEGKTAPEARSTQRGPGGRCTRTGGPRARRQRRPARAPPSGASAARQARQPALRARHERERGEQRRAAVGEQRTPPSEARDPCRRATTRG